MLHIERPCPGNCLIVVIIAVVDIVRVLKSKAPKFNPVSGFHDDGGETRTTTTARRKDEAHTALSTK